MRRWIVSAALVLHICGLGSAPALAQLCGDCTHDGVINEVDAAAAKLCALGQGPCPALCDTDHNTTVDFADAARMTEVSLGLLDICDPGNNWSCDANPTPGGAPGCNPGGH